ncbi:hypothetical protein TEQG_06624 [Trichophyton equinum CBS 127.97]|uniref:Uncharacterized protein n=1 Tax=Trichophyton equinum (strain ATCC MYA-4606 / CBS 127.97) TaxID=559882 RepID=F2Q0H1_TRIEC|nr:hypothetical protein TEQG_06624 [Trichophyton equinum CBS 127.97]
MADEALQAKISCYISYQQKESQNLESQGEVLRQLQSLAQIYTQGMAFQSYICMLGYATMGYATPYRQSYEYHRDDIKSQSVELLGIGNGMIILRKIEVGMRKLSYLRLKSIMRYVLRAETIDMSYLLGTLPGRSSEDNKNDPRIRVTQLVFESDDEGEESNAVDDLSK